MNNKEKKEIWLGKIAKIRNVINFQLLQKIRNHRLNISILMIMN